MLNKNWIQVVLTALFFLMIILLPASVLAQENDLSGYKSKFRDKLIAAFKFSGQGKVHAAFKLESNGSISKLECTERGQSTANAESIRKMIQSCQPFTPAPAKLIKKPFVWFYFNWKNDLYSVSGPYFEESYPNHVVHSIL
ncbi:hypothetical protein KA183_12005 [bacterium]|nr:hypothetical protein [bacterium]QQR57098.1 MAG: hypothetical protein IPG59_19245 [Candidatus Melainabacteria bacterium]